MDHNATQIELLFQKVEAYSKTSLKLFKLKVIDASASLVSAIIYRLILLMLGALFSLLFTLGVALYLGQLLGETFYGFLVSAMFYLCIGLLVYINRKRWIINPISNSTIKQLMKQNSDEN